MVSPCSDRISRVPPYSRTIMLSTRTGLSPATAKLSRMFRFKHNCHWPGPRSLATTCGVSVDVLSCRYLDVSVPCVRSILAMNSPAGTWLLHQVSFLIQKSTDQRLFASFPKLIAGYHVFHRLSMPRHPPHTLSNLTTIIDHRRPSRLPRHSTGKLLLFHNDSSESYPRAGERLF